MNNRQRTYYADGLLTPQQQNFKLRSDIVQDHAEGAAYHAHERGASEKKQGFFARLFSKKRKK